MAITTLPSSPAGEINHNTVREKVNEIVEQTNDLVDVELFAITSTDLLLDDGIHDVHVSSANNAVILTLDDSPEVGQHHLIYIGHNENLITLNTANPSFPIGDVPIIAEDAVQGLWALAGDFLDRFSTGRDLTLQGTGGSFIADVVQGRNVQVFDTEGTAGLKVIGYKGILGTQPRSFTTWIAFNSEPTNNQYLTTWGSDDSGGGRWWKINFQGQNNKMTIQLKNAGKDWTHTALNAVNLFDGNMHHFAVTMFGTNATSITLFIDGVELPNTSSDNNPSMDTLPEYDFGIATDFVSITPVDARLYDVRLFDRALSLAEVQSVFNDNISGGITLSQGTHNTVYDVIYDGVEWVVSVGVQTSLLEVTARVSTLENAPPDEFFQILSDDGDYLMELGAINIEVEVGTTAMQLTLPQEPGDGDFTWFYTSGDIVTYNITVISGTADTVDDVAARVFNKQDALCIFIYKAGNWGVFHEHGKTPTVEKLLVTMGFVDQPLSIHDGLAGTETVIQFGTDSNSFFAVTATHIEVLQDVDSAQVLVEMHVDKTVGGSDSILSTWIETSLDSGSNWSPLASSLRVETVAKDGETVVISELSLDDPTPAGVFFRVKATNTGAAAISILPPTDLTVSTGTSSGFATKVSLRTD